MKRITKIMTVTAASILMLAACDAVREASKPQPWLDAKVTPTKCFNSMAKAAEKVEGLSGNIFIRVKGNGQDKVISGWGEGILWSETPKEPNLTLYNFMNFRSVRNKFNNKLAISKHNAKVADSIYGVKAERRGGFRVLIGKSHSGDNKYLNFEPYTLKTVNGEVPGYRTRSTITEGNLNVGTVLGSLEDSDLSIAHALRWIADGGKPVPLKMDGRYVSPKYRELVRKIDALKKGKHVDTGDEEEEEVNREESGDTAEATAEKPASSLVALKKELSEYVELYSLTPPPVGAAKFVLSNADGEHEVSAAVWGADGGSAAILLNDKNVVKVKFEPGVDLKGVGVVVFVEQPAAVAGGTTKNKMFLACTDEAVEISPDIIKDISEGAGYLGVGLMKIDTVNDPTKEEGKLLYDMWVYDQVNVKFKKKEEKKKEEKK